MLAGTGLAEKGVEGIIATPDCFVTGHLTIRLDAMLKAEELPACIANLDTALTKVKTKHLTHYVNEAEEEVEKESSGEVPEKQQLDVCRVM
jgi:hypothetical protein